MNLTLLSPEATRPCEDCYSRLLFPPDTFVPLEEADIAIIQVSYQPDFVMNPALEDLKIPWVMLDYLEYFGQWDGNLTHLIGRSGGPADFCRTPEFVRFAQWVADNPPVCYFKRELLEVDAKKRKQRKVYPLEFGGVADIPPISTFEEFTARPIEVFNCWGYSNLIRSTFHGQVFTEGFRAGLQVVDSFPMLSCVLNNPELREDLPLWASIYTPHFQRRPIEDIYKVQAMSKVSLAFPGSGVKCFRHAESPVGCVMAVPSDKFAWSYPWLHMENCVRFMTEGESQVLLLANRLRLTHPEKLYEVYVEGQLNLANYLRPNYFNNYILPTIQSHL